MCPEPGELFLERRIRQDQILMDMNDPEHRMQHCLDGYPNKREKVWEDFEMTWTNTGCAFKLH
jgi:hypothetical protein